MRRLGVECAFRSHANPGRHRCRVAPVAAERRKYEFVDEEIRESPAGAWHGRVSLRLGARVLAFVVEKGLGEVFDSSTGFRLPGGNVRSPDVSFVSAARLPGGRVPKGFFEGAPDLAVEVLSPDDRERERLDKVGEYLSTGVRRVWVIDPDARRAAIYSACQRALE